jgi:hypothetical protein
MVSCITYEAHASSGRLGVVEVAPSAMVVTYCADGFSERIGKGDRRGSGSVLKVVGKPSDVPGGTMDAARFNASGYGDTVEDTDQVTEVEDVVLVDRPVRSRVGGVSDSHHGVISAGRSSHR